MDIEGLNAPEIESVDIGAVLSGVNMTDRPVLILLFLYACLTALAVVARRRKFWRAVVFVIAMVIALLSERVGKYLEAHWKAVGFSKNYFDEDNVFLLFFFVIPPMSICILLLSLLMGDVGGRICERYLIKPKTD